MMFNDAGILEAIRYHAVLKVRCDTFWAKQEAFRSLCPLPYWEGRKLGQISPIWGDTRELCKHLRSLAGVAKNLEKDKHALYLRGLAAGIGATRRHRERCTPHMVYPVADMYSHLSNLYGEAGAARMTQRLLGETLPEKE